MRGNQTQRPLLAETVASPNGPARALREHAERAELGALWFGMVRSVNRTALGASRWKWDDAAPNTAKRNPLGAVYADTLLAIAAGAGEAETCEPFDRLAQMVRSAFRAAHPLPPVPTVVEIAETDAQGRADVAVRKYLAEPDDSPRKAEYAANAANCLACHLAELARLRDAVCQDRVRVLHIGRRLNVAR